MAPSILFESTPPAWTPCPSTLDLALLIPSPSNRDFLLKRTNVISQRDARPLHKQTLPDLASLTESVGPAEGSSSAESSDWPWSEASSRSDRRYRGQQAFIMSRATGSSSRTSRRPHELRSAITFLADRSCKQLLSVQTFKKP